MFSFSHGMYKRSVAFTDCWWVPCSFPLQKNATQAPTCMLGWRTHFWRAASATVPRFRKNSDSSTKQKWRVQFPWPSVLGLTHPHLHASAACFHSAGFVCMSGTRGGSQDILQPLSFIQRKGGPFWPRVLLNANWQVAGANKGDDTTGPSQQARNQGTRLAPVVTA